MIDFVICSSLVLIYILCGFKVADHILSLDQFWDLIDQQPPLTGVPRQKITAICTVLILIFWIPFVMIKIFGLVTQRRGGPH